MTLRISTMTISNSVTVRMLPKRNESALACSLPELMTVIAVMPAAGLMISVGKLVQMAGADMGVVMTVAGYPGRYRQGDVISGLPTPDEELGDAKLFHAGTQETKDGQVVTHGGRVLCATALGATVAEAQSLAYNLARQVDWEGVYYRTDIGYRAIAREQE